MARRIWWELEPIHAVTYFAPECREASKAVGLRGFWMGYFATRAAPMGSVAPAVVESTFFNFHPDMVRRAIPDAWGLADPGTIVAKRSVAATRAIVRLAPGAVDAWSRLLPLMVVVIDRGSAAGRPLFSANRDLMNDASGVSSIWPAVTTLREHRGDGHVAVLTESGLEGCDAHVLFAATEAVPPALLREARGWSEIEWEVAVERLGRRGLVEPDGAATALGRRLRRRIEQRTDELAAEPYRSLGDTELEELLRTLPRLAQPIVASGELPFPNPMGLPRRPPA